MSERIGHWINGQTAFGVSSLDGPVFDPATGRESARVAYANVQDVDEAVANAHAAFLDWRVTSLALRTRVMFSFRSLVDAAKDELADLIAGEHGKTKPDARGEVLRGLETIEFACGLSSHLKGENSQQVSTGIDIHSVREPLGVIGCITPFNFPVMVPLWMVPVAIASGNTVVLKPSEKDPSVSNRVAELFVEAGGPPGVFNVIHGGREAVERLIEHPDVPALSFVGSTPVARSIYEEGSRQGKRVQALGGAKNHMLVLPDADMDLAADAAVSAGFGSAGERCMAISVVVAVGRAADDLKVKIAERIRDLQVGPASDPASAMGPVITREHKEFVESCIGSGVEAGASLVTDGRLIKVPGHEEGFFVGPTLFDHVTSDMEIYQREVFGPVLSIVRVEHFAEAIELVNRNPYANGTAIFTNDGGAARRFQREIQVGMVGVNVAIPVPVGFYSFGGWKSSLFGAHSIYGPDGIHFYTRPKVVTTRWADPVHRGVDLGFPRNT
ncbi:MAG: methylmalonate-semialdehyde dehydrogenase (CoA acylating) [Deltaproteobacteria bacterium]|nr:methylmalonate-semialdehyde dehydrogenase (CoA acylating) [Deltaproteobacteria bacterium]